MPVERDYTGLRFGKLTVIGECDYKKWNKKVLKCLCDCGNEKDIMANYLVSGDTKSCGCYTKKFNQTHGDSYTRLYIIWKSMKSRCLYNKESLYYQTVPICQSWIDSYEAFKLDMESGYSEGKQLDRIDPELGYCKENCRWVTPSENNANSRSRSNSASKYKGVHKYSGKRRWAVKLYFNGKYYWGGTFDDEDEAALAYNKLALEVQGEYARLNIIGQDNRVK